MTVIRSRPRILEDLSSLPPGAAAAAVLLLSACATADGGVQQQLDSTRAEVRTLQKENAELARRVDAMATQIDILQSRHAPRPAAPPPAPAPEARTAPSRSEPAPAIPPDLKVVKLEPPRTTPASSPRSGTSPRPSRAPAVPTDTPIQEPTPEGAAP